MNLYENNFLLKNTSDNIFYDSFFHFSNNCTSSVITGFYLEIFLILYIIYNIMFFQEKLTNNKTLFINFVLFQVFLISFIFLDICFFNKFYIQNDIMINDGFTMFSKFMILVFFCFITFICKNKFFIKLNIKNLKEIPIIFSFLILFIFILLSAYDFFLIYLTIEGISLVVYTLGSVMSESLINLESTIKYFLINNLASSILLWSISYLYILIGTTDCFELKFFLSSNIEIIEKTYLYYLCITLILSLFIKLALFPFHWWIADIFEGWWTPITFIYAVVIKFTFFLFLFKLITNIFSNIVFLFQPFFLIASLGSVIIGSIGALTQVRIKRFLAYTSIAQSGYILIGLSCNSLNGFLSSFIYLFMYCFITLSFFCVLINIEHVIKGNNIIYFNQLYSLFTFNKEVSFHLILIIFVMAAIPPFASFFAKFFIFVISIEAKQEFIIFIILLMSLISTFYYLNFIQQLIFFKLNESKIYFFRNNRLLNNYLRFNSFFFVLGIFFYSYIIEFSLYVCFVCTYPLSFIY